MLINILWRTLGANKDDGPSWRTGSIFSCSKGLWDCLPTKPITTKQQSVFWLVTQSRRMLTIYVGSCQWQLVVPLCLPQTTISKAVNKLCKRLNACVLADGGRFEHIM